MRVVNETIQKQDQTFENHKYNLISVEQYARDRNLEILGIAEVARKDCRNFVVTVAIEMKINIVETDIDVAYRITLRNGKKNIMTQFSRKKKRDSWLN